MKHLKSAGIILSYIVCFAISGYALAFLFIDSFQAGNSFKAKVLENYLTMFLHMFGGSLALATGVLAISERFRNHSLNRHRILGKLYCMGVLMGSVGSIFMSFLSTGGIVTHVGFGLCSIVWAYSTYRGYRAIRKKQIEEHRVWMIRSFSITLIAVALRIELPFLSIYSGSEFSEVYKLVSWFAWVPNLIIAEWFVIPKRSNGISQVNIIT